MNPIPRRWKRFFAVGVLGLVSVGGAWGQPQGEAQIIRSSRFIFAGTVEKPGGSNLSLVPASAKTALVRVRDVIDAPATMGDLRGRLITVLLAKEGSAQAGDKSIFFTNGWMYGENVAVREIAETPDRGDGERLRGAVASERRKVEDETLASRIGESALVVSGAVVAIKPVARREGTPRSEHDPEWRSAEIAIGATLRGKAPGPSVTAFYPNSTDERWLLAPKLREGQKAIFLLQPYRGRDLPAGALVLLLPQDVQPEQELDRIRRLVR